MSAGGIQNDQNSDGEVPPGILQLLRGLFPGGEIQVESSQGTGTGSVTEQERTSSAVAQEAEPMVTEEGIFLSRMLEQIMPLISEHGDGSTSSTPVSIHSLAFVVLTCNCY